MTKASYLIAFISINVLISACSSEKGADDLQTIKDMREIQRQAHLQGDADLLVSVMADTLTMIQDGDIQKVPNEDVRALFEEYFQTVHYQKWDDIGEPEIIISKDQTLANVMVKKELQMAVLKEGQKNVYQKSQWAWLSTYRKVDGEWRFYAISSGIQR